MRNIVSPLEGIRSPFGPRYGAFSPASLFAAGEQGVWYDPSDFSTMFQDSAGTTPVTAVEQPVGRILDKSGRGNHATQSTTASRPVLSARVNLLTYSEQFDNAAWTKTALNTTGTPPWVNVETAPNGTTTADKLIEAATTSSHRVSQSITSVIGTVYTASIYAKAAERTFVALRIDNLPNSFAWFNLATGAIGTTQPSVTATIANVGGGWYLCRVTGTATATNHGLEAYVADADNSTTYTGNGTSGIYIWGADLRPTNQTTLLPAYQRIAAATDYDTTGFPFYLRFDGTDDSMATGTINFSTTDKMSVFHGHRIAGTAYGVLVNGPVATYATFQSVVHDSAKYQGNITTSGSAYWLAETAAIYSSPRTDVSAIQLDTAKVGATNVIKYRLNGTLLSLTGAIGGAPSNVNFGNMPLIIGMYPTGSNRFNGNLYSLIVLGRTATATEITNTETWVNGKTLAY